MKITTKLTLFQRIRRLSWYLIVILLVIGAISMTLARTLISNVGGLRDQLENIASQYLDQPLKIEIFDAEIVGFTPTFIFRNVSLLEHSSNKVMVRFKEARVGLSIYNSIKNGELRPKSFVISGINLVVTQNKNSTFKVKGIDVAEFDPLKNVDNTDSSELSNWLFQQETLKLENSTIHWYNANTNKVLKFSNINLQLNNSNTRHTLSGDWRLQNKLAKRFKIELDMVGNILNPASWEGAVYVKGDEVNISEFGIPSNLIPLKPASGIYNFEVWADFKLGQLKEITGATNVRNLKFDSSNLNNIIEIDKMGAVWRWDNLADGWALNIDRFHYEVNNKIWPLSRVLVESHHRFQPDPIIDIYIDKLDIEDASRFIQKLKVLDQGKIARLQNIDPHGRIFDTHLRFSLTDVFSKDFIFQSEFSNIKINPDEFIPGVRNMSGSISTSNSQGSLVINSKNANLNFSKLFRNKIDFNEFNGRFNWQNKNKEWHVSGENINIYNNDIQTNSKLHLIFPDSNKSPLIDLQVNFKNGNIASAGKYFPVAIMDKSLIEWLDNSLKSGSVSSGGVVLQGRLNNFPYLNQSGKFEVSLESENFVLRYQEDWPKIYNAAANIKFSGAGFDIDISKAKMLGSNISDTTVSIHDFTAPQLVIKGNLNSSTHEVFKFLANSPIANDSRSIIESFKVTGESSVKLQIHVPLSEQMQKSQSLYYSGVVNINDSTISLHKNLIEFKNIHGILAFTENGFSSNNIHAQIFDKPSKIRIYTQAKNKTFSQHLLVQGKINSETMSDKFNIPWMEKSTGIANWQSIFNFGYNAQSIDIPASLVITTDLQGINLDLPKPLNKESTAKLPISIEYEFISSELNRINIAIDEDFSINSEIKKKNNIYELNSAAVNFNIKSKAVLKDKQILVRGDIRNINLDSWLSFINDLNESGGSDNFISSDLNIVFDVDSYRITDPKEDVNFNSRITKKVPAENVSHIDPRKVPAFSGEIRNIYYDSSRVGDLSFNFEHTENGFNIKKLNLHSEFFDFTSSGIWHIFPDENKNRYLTKFTNVKFLSSDLGTTLSSLGYKSILKQGKSNSDLTLWWHDSPFGFSIEKLSAEILVNLYDGEILNVDLPQAGRLLGLLSLSNLPRRLFGDFSDVFGGGVSFDSIIGTARIAKGVISTEDIIMTTSPAEIHITGETDLVNRKFDQTVRVVPNVTDALSVTGGLILGLPVLLATQLLGGIMNFDEVKMPKYHISGTWDKPVITEIIEPNLIMEDSMENTVEFFDESDDY